MPSTVGTKLQIARAGRELRARRMSPPIARCCRSAGSSWRPKRRWRAGVQPFPPALRSGAARHKAPRRQGGQNRTRRVDHRFRLGRFAHAEASWAGRTVWANARKERSSELETCRARLPILRRQDRAQRFLGGGDDRLLVIARAHPRVGEDAVVGNPPERLIVYLLGIRFEYEPLS